MADLKTKPTKASVESHLEEVDNVLRREDAFVMLELMKKITGKKPVLWGNNIIGFGQYHYKYASGQEGDWPVTGFAVRKTNLTIYIMPGFNKFEAELKKLGKHKHSVSCLYVKKLADVDVKILEKMISESIKEMGKLYEITA